MVGPPEVKSARASRQTSYVSRRSRGEVRNPEGFSALERRTRDPDFAPYFRLERGFAGTEMFSKCGFDL